MSFFVSFPIVSCECRSVFCQTMVEKWEKAVAPFHTTLHGLRLSAHQCVGTVGQRCRNVAHPVLLTGFRKGPQCTPHAWLSRQADDASRDATSGTHVFAGSCTRRRAGAPTHLVLC